MKYAFANFLLDADRAELQRDGQAVRVEPQVFDLLKLLVSAEGRMVSREEIFEAIWGNQIVSDAALSSRIKDARKALGDDGTTQKFIRTIHRRGLIFVGEVEAQHQQPAVVRQPAHDPDGQNADSLHRPALAVLPLEDLSGETPFTAFSRTLTDELTIALASWRVFRVISRQSATRLDPGLTSAREIGAALSAEYLLHGTIRRTSSKIKVQVTLTRASANTDIWSDRLECHLDELVDLEEEVAAQVAGLVAPEVQGAEARQLMHKAPADWTVWETAMRATALLRSGRRSDFDEAERMAEKACQMAENWTLPYTLIAISRFQKAMAGFSAADSSEAFKPALEAAAKALEIDQNAWLAHALTAVGELWTNRNHHKAKLHVERAIELNPSASLNYHFGGCITGFSGDPAAARAYQERLFRIDPTYPYRAVIEADLGLWHMLDEQWEPADDRLHRAMLWDPTYGRALQRRIALAGLLDDHPAARKAARQLKDLGLPLDIDTIQSSYPFKRPEHAEMFADGLRRGGVNL